MGYQVNVQPSGRQFEVLDGETVLEAGIRQGIGLPYGCKDGACGSCKCRKISGSVEHKPYQPSALSEDEAAQGFVLTCRAVPGSDLVLESRQVTSEGAYPVRKMPVRVMGMEQLSSDVMRLTLQLPANAPMQFHAGQYLDFLLADGQRRSYSMATAPHQVDPNKPQVELHVRHMPGGKFTDHVFSAMKEKEILRVEGPFGSFFLRDNSAGPVLFLASGTGFAPIKAILEHMTHTGNQRKVFLYWGARRPVDIYMHQWMLDYCAAHPNVSYVPVVSDALPEDVWEGKRGLALDQMLQDHPDMSSYQLYACGVPAMVHAAHAQCVGKAQLPEDSFFADAFTSLKDKTAQTATSA